MSSSSQWSRRSNPPGEQKAPARKAACSPDSWPANPGSPFALINNTLKGWDLACMSPFLRQEANACHQSHFFLEGGRILSQAERASGSGRLSSISIATLFSTTPGLRLWWAQRQDQRASLALYSNQVQKGPFSQARKPSRTFSAAHYSDLFFLVLRSWPILDHLSHLLFCTWLSEEGCRVY